MAVCCCWGGATPRRTSPRLEPTFELPLYAYGDVEQLLVLAFLEVARFGGDVVEGAITSALGNNRVVCGVRG